MSNSASSKNYVDKVEKLVVNEEELVDYTVVCSDALRVGFDKDGKVVMCLTEPNKDNVSKSLYKDMEEVHKKTKGKDVNKLYSTNNREDLIIVYGNGNVDVIDVEGVCDVKALSKWKNIAEIKMIGNYVFGSDNTGKIHKLKIDDGYSLPSDDEVEKMTWDDISKAEYCAINLKEN